MLHRCRLDYYRSSSTTGAQFRFSYKPTPVFFTAIKSVQWPKTSLSVDSSYTCLASTSIEAAEDFI